MLYYFLNKKLLVASSVIQVVVLQKIPLWRTHRYVQVRVNSLIVAAFVYL